MNRAWVLKEEGHVLSCVGCVDGAVVMLWMNGTENFAKLIIIIFSFCCKKDAV